MPRLGLHVHQNNKRSDILDWYQKLQPSAILFLSVDDVFVRDIKAVSPGTKAIGRHVVNGDEQRLSGDKAKAFMQTMKRKALEHPSIDYWIGYNEAFAGEDEIGQYAEFEINRMKMLESIGRKALIGGFAQGTPEITDGGKTWAKFRPALEHAKAHGHALHLHSYAGPYIGYGVNTPDGKNQWNHAANRFGGHSTDPAVWQSTVLDGWHTLRYRMVYRLFAQWGLGDLPLYLTEFGNDDTVPRPGPTGAGYKDFRGTEWARVPGLGDFADQCRWYMWQASHDPYLKGVVLFGWDGSSLGWGSFDCSNDPPTRDRILATQAGLPVGHFGATPAPQPQPEQPMPTPTPSGIINMPAMHHSPRGGTRARYVVVHSTDSPAGSTPDGTARYLANNDRKVSSHELVAPLAVYIMVPDDRAAHHAGYATLPDGTTGGAVNLASWGLEIYQESGRPCAPELVDVAAGRVAGACKRLNIPAARVVSHAEIDPGRRSDPVGVKMTDFRARVAAMLAEGGQPLPAPGGVQWGKVVWHLEDMTRRMEAEGQRMEAALVKSTWLPEAIRHRDGKA